MVHNPKYVEGVSSRRKHSYCPRENGNDNFVVLHENFFWEVFFQAERAWAQACEIQAQQGKSRHSHIQRRLNKALKWANRLPDIAKRLSCDEVTLKEILSYTTWVKGNAALERKLHLEAFRAYRESQSLLNQLAESTVADVKESSVNHVISVDSWKKRSESVLKPLVRYCHYEARDQLGETDTLHTDDRADLAKKEGSSEIALRFRGKEVSLDSHKELAVLYLKIEDAISTSLDSVEESRFIQLLSDLDDALKWTQAEIHRFSTLPPGPAVTAKTDELNIMSAYFRYQKLSVWRHQQEKVLVDLSEDVAILHVFDNLMQNANTMIELIESDANVDLQEDSFWIEAQANMVRIRAFRCFYLARIYASVGVETSDFPLISLLQHARQLAKRGQEEFNACHSSDSDKYVRQLGDLISKIAAAECQIEISTVLTTMEAPVSQQTTRPLWMRLDELDSGCLLTDAPPLPLYIPGKPVFYDIAWQHVAGDPTASERIKSVLNSQRGSKSSSHGFLSSIFG